MQKKKSRAVAMLLAICIAGGIFAFAVFAADPGTDGDPLVTLSYIESKVIPELKSYIDRAAGGGGSTPAAADAFTVVNVAGGKTFWAKGSTEFILRMGRATVFTSPKGGLVDSTAGADLTGGYLPANHLIICPIDDGRGFKAENDVIIMVRGAYVIS